MVCHMTSPETEHFQITTRCCRRTVCDRERRAASPECPSDGRRDVHVSCEGSPDRGAGGEGHQARRAGWHHDCRWQGDFN